MGKKRVQPVHLYLHLSHCFFLPTKVAWKQSLKFQLVPLLIHSAVKKHSEINTPAGYYPICDRNQQQITPRKVQENRIICTHKKLFLVMGFLRLLCALKPVGFYPSNMKERTKVANSNYPLFSLL